MNLYRYRTASYGDLAHCLSALPDHERLLAPEQMLAHWRRWFCRGALNASILERCAADRPPQTVGVGVSLWLSDAGVETLLAGLDGVSVITSLYRAANGGDDWAVDHETLCELHARQGMNLLVLHFWVALAPTDPELPPLFAQAHASFREVHEGFGVGRLLQQVPAPQVPILSAAGMRPIHELPGRPPLVLMAMDRQDARATPGSTFSFLFFAHPRSLPLTAAQQRMIGLALNQLTDDQIAARMGCSRRYVRNLWNGVYVALEAAHDSNARAQSPADDGSNARGPERRRRALAFLRLQPQELRPGLPPLCPESAD
jgi:DNA-binding CsgD family transcriptional regulator